MNALNHSTHDLCIYVHILPFPKQEGRLDSAFVNRLLPIISRTWGKGEQKGVSYYTLIE